MARNLNKTVIKSLTSSQLWPKIEKDCHGHNVFFSMRNNTADFYHKGGRLFCFDKGFSTHLKYAAVIKKNKDDYLTESDLANHQLATDFAAGYSRIKENCSKYSGLEAAGVASIYHKNSFMNKTSNVVVLDIEVSFKALVTGRKIDRIDILLLNKKLKTLQFVEAKHYSNSELRSTTTPKVLGQLHRYESQIAKEKKTIISDYKAYIKTLNGLFNISLPAPVAVEDKVTLLVFGFDRDQEKGGVAKLKTPYSKYSGVKLYAIGNVKGLVTENLWNASVVK